MIRLIAILFCAAMNAAAATAPAEKPAEAPAPKKGLFHTSENVSDIASHVTAIEKRLEGIEQSVKSVPGLEKSVGEINTSIAGIAALVRIETLHELETSAADVALVRGAILILLATACGAGLLFLQAWLRRRYPPAK
jgi:hypothetical protein